MKAVIKTWKATLGVIKDKPYVIFPLVIAGIANIGLLYIIYRAPQKPVSFMLAPPIRVFFGAEFLHYPFNLFILPKIFSYGANVLNIFFGSLMAAMVVGITADIVAEERTSLLINFIRSIKRYFALVGVYGLMFILVTAILGLLSKFLHAESGIIEVFLVVIFFMVAIFIQILFIYAIPLIIIDNKSLFSALKENMAVLKKMLCHTLVLVFIPSLIYLPIPIIKSKLFFLANKFSPEIILIVLAAGVIISFVVEIVITISATILFLNRSRPVSMRSI